MNSRFLFRGKRKENNEDGKAWLCGCLQVLEDVSCGATSYYIHHPRGGRMNHMHLVDPATIGQCTGLKDKNGNLIFEGDIVRKQMRKNNYYITTIVWIAAGFERHGEHGYHPIHGSELKIIGNIHDNPDLLEVSGE